MPNGYWIPHLDVSNPAGFQAYRDAADAAHERYADSKLLVRGGQNERPEGQIRSRNVMRQFKSYEEAHAFYNGPDYSVARPLRQPHSQCDFLIVEGYEGPQPSPPSTSNEGNPKGYWICHTDVDDPNGIGSSMTSEFTPLSRFGGRFLVCGGRQEVVEGQLRSQCVVLEFPSFKAATDCYHSPEYQDAAKQRQGRGQSNLILIEGIAS